MDLKQKISADLKIALKDKNLIRANTLRLVITAISRVETAKKRKEVTEEDIQQLISGEIKKRNEAIEAYTKGGRPELAQKEKAEAEILKTYLPEPLSEIEIEAVIKKVIQELGASSLKDIGKVMGQVMAQLKGKADGKLVKEKVGKILNPPDST